MRAVERPLPADALDRDACVRLGCQAEGRCLCSRNRQRPRVQTSRGYWELYSADTPDARWWPSRHPRASRRKLSKAKRARVLERDGYRCRRCGARKDLEIDHIQPVAFGGTDDEGNLQVLCEGCNRLKGYRQPEASA